MSERIGVSGVMDADAWKHALPRDSAVGQTFGGSGENPKMWAHESELVNLSDQWHTLCKSIGCRLSGCIPLEPGTT